MSLPWFRMYAEFATDTKVQSMDETLQRRFVMFLCLHCAGEFERLDDDELAFALRISADDLVRTKEVFTRKGFLDADGKIRNWDKRQFKSDNSTERVREHRERKRNEIETFQERPQKQIQITDTDSEKIQATAAVPPRVEPCEFGELKKIFPKRAGDQPWPAALQACNARLRENHTWDEILAGARRYAAFCEATGKVRTEIVMQAKRFVGPSKPFLNDWSLPATKAEVRQDRSISASEQWLREQEAKDAAH
jgi:hypothetical protein